MILRQLNGLRSLLLPLFTKGKYNYSSCCSTFVHTRSIASTSFSCSSKKQPLERIIDQEVDLEPTRSPDDPPKVKVKTKFERQCLVWAGYYKNEDEVPPEVEEREMKRARQVRVCLLVTWIVAGILYGIIVIYLYNNPQIFPLQRLEATEKERVMETHRLYMEEVARYEQAAKLRQEARARGEIV